jgi:hypothetical protein
MVISLRCDVNGFQLILCKVFSGNTISRRAEYSQGGFPPVAGSKPLRVPNDNR